MTPIKAGDEVRVFTRNPYVRDPAEGAPGRVTKVGRKYATATYDRTRKDWRGNENTAPTEVEFSIATGFERGDQLGNGIRVLTPEQAEAQTRGRTARAVLRELGVDIRFRSSLTGEQIEALAELAKTFTTDPEG